MFTAVPSSTFDAVRNSKYKWLEFSHTTTVVARRLLLNKSDLQVSTLPHQVPAAKTKSKNKAKTGRTAGHQPTFDGSQPTLYQDLPQSTGYAEPLQKILPDPSLVMRQDRQRTYCTFVSLQWFVWRLIGPSWNGRWPAWTYSPISMKYFWSSS